MKQEDIEILADQIAARVAKRQLDTKEVLTFEEAANYMGLSKSHLYKLTMGQEIPHFKPHGKMVYFNRVEVEQWLQNNRICTVEEAKAKADLYCKRGGVL